MFKNNSLYLSPNCHFCILVRNKDEEWMLLNAVRGPLVLFFIALYPSGIKELISQGKNKPKSLKNKVFICAIHSVQRPRLLSYFGCRYSGGSGVDPGFFSGYFFGMRASSRVRSPDLSPRLHHPI